MERNLAVLFVVAFVKSAQPSDGGLILLPEAFAALTFVDSAKPSIEQHDVGCARNHQIGRKLWITGIALGGAGAVVGVAGIVTGMLSWGGDPTPAENLIKAGAGIGCMGAICVPFGFAIQHARCGKRRK